MAVHPDTPLFHATGITAALGIMRDGAIRIDFSNGLLVDGRETVSFSRDQRYRFCGAGYHDEVGNPVVEVGHGPVQFVFGRNRLRQRHRLRPHDMAVSRFDTKDVNTDDEFGGWKLSGNLRRLESEEVALLPAGGRICLSLAAALTLEPVTADWLRLHHEPEDQQHLDGTGARIRCRHQVRLPRHEDGADTPIDLVDGFDYRGVRKSSYDLLQDAAAALGLPVVDRRENRLPINRPSKDAGMALFAAGTRIHRRR